MLRNRIAVASTPTQLQTTGFDITRNRRLSDAKIEDNISPRTAVSARFQRLELHNNISPTRRTTRRLSWSIHQDQGAEMAAQDSSQHCSDNVVAIDETPEPSTSSFAISETTQEGEPDATQHDMEHAMFEFKAGGAPEAAPHPPVAHASPSKRARYAVSDEPATPSPSKRRRQSSASPAPTPIPRSQSPSARKLPKHKKRISESSNDSDPDIDEAELAQFWWQPSEITGYDPADPEEDNRGVNGIGYQKTKQEAWKIAQQRKKQIVEWRSREAKEARSLRAGGRRTLTGRISKPGSRAGSPVEVRNRSSPVSKSATQAEGSPSKAVRFEVG
ncbi:hypothetical protein OHC33_001612 [Knufia fluminis]|uniref:Uncharacterized protein n=1 Tax=Knufia fluminis TaxID=191047 RepID=A0AAN8EVZ8_9EURO|nr:hypothetical protein OHC33_001612 [Knufia fluminis]